MAASPIKLRAKLSGDQVKVKAILNHPMESGNRKDADGKIIPAHFIKTVTCKMGDEIIMEADFGGGVSKNPYIAFQFSGGKKGDELTLSWSDNMGKSATAKGKVK